MEAECLRISQLPHQNRLFVEYVENFSRVAEFYPTPPNDTKAISERSRGLEYPAERRAAMAKILERQNREFSSSPEVLKNIERFRDGAAAIVSGQQVVLFGGPAYSFYKALTAIRLARELEKGGTPVVPIFWLATQDHDFAEVSKITLRSSVALKTFSIERTGVEGAPVGGVKLDEKAAAVAREAAAFLGDTAETKDLVRCYATGQTLGSAFGKLFAAVFGRLGLVLFDPSDEAVSRLAAPVLTRAAELAPELTENLLTRGRALENAGYEQQVKVTNSSTLLFATVNGVRTPVRRVNGERAIGTRKLKLEELRQEIASEPERFSGNALLRPVVQDFLLPTLTYIGGPAEVAYFAQAGVVYEKILGRITPILPRLSATLLDARDQRLLAKYKLSLLQVIQAGRALKEKLGSRSFPTRLDSDFQQTSAAIQSSVAQLGEELNKLDPTLAEAGKHSFSKMCYQLERLRGRAARALITRDQEIARHAVSLGESLYPNQELQERVIAGISFFSQFGPDLIERLDDGAKRNCPGHLALPL
jgi:bacillithiol biosynthesis cysteine-adding enzyme BshC